MKNIILALVIVVMVSTPCFAEVETEGLFSVDGTFWIACGKPHGTGLGSNPSYNCDKELGFYQGRVYGDFRTLSPSYDDLLGISFAFEYQNRGNLFRAIMLPIGLGVFSWNEIIPPDCARCAPKYYYYETGILLKINDDWTPPGVE